MEDHEWPEVFATEMALGSTRHRRVRQHLKIGKQSGHTVRVQVMLTRGLLLLWRLPLVSMLHFLERSSIAIPPRFDARMPLYGISGLRTFGSILARRCGSCLCMPRDGCLAPCPELSGTTLRMMHGTDGKTAMA